MTSNPSSLSSPRSKTLRRLGAAFVILASVLTAVSLAVPALAAPEKEASFPRFEKRACWFPIPEGQRATCGHMHVAENRSRPDTRAISFPVVILHAEDGADEDDPLVVAGGGGPGGSLRLEAHTIPYHFSVNERVALARGRDVVLVEQRGVGRSDPNLACPEIAKVSVAELASRPSLETSVASYTKAATTCRDRLVAAGVDLTAYRGDQSAADLEELRRALGYRKWNLWGTSYGARLVMTVMREFPDGLRSAILDSPVPFEVEEFERVGSDSDRVLRKIFDACASQAACQSRFPRLEDDFEAVRERLSKEPVRLVVSHPVSLEPTPVVVDDVLLTTLLIYGFYDADAIATIPMMLSALARGSHDLLAPFARVLVEQSAGVGLSEGLYLSTMCSDELPFNDLPAAIAAARAYPWVAKEAESSLATMQALCGVWPTTPPDPRESQALASAIPTLILSGEYDPVTPPRFGAQIDAQLANSRFFRFPASSHDVFAHSSCADELMLEFLRRPKRAKRGSDADCLGDEAVLDFALTP